MTTTPWYATREEIKAELDVKETARSNARIDRALADATESLHGLCKRIFYPRTDIKYFNWPDSQYGTSWRLWLDESELISVNSLSSGGTTIAASDYILEPNRTGPPYTRLEILLSSSAAFGGGSTHQRDITVDGVWAGAPLAETSVGSVIEALDSSETGVDVDAATSAAVGVGNLLRIDSERVIVTGRSMLDTGQTLGGAGLTNQNNSVTVTVASGAAFAAGETILIDGERMRVDDIAGNTLIVTRAWDGSTIAAHSVGAAIYAPRTLTVTRGALGTSAAAHLTASAVYRWDAPGPVRQLTIAEALTDLLQGRSGYARTAGSGESERETTGKSLNDLRDRVYTSHGRKGRVRSV